VTVQAWFSTNDVVADPGSPVTLALTVQNLGEHTETFNLVPAGLTAGWTTVETGSLTLFAGSQAIVHVTVLPPALPTTTAGPTVASVRVMPQQHPEDAFVVETTLDVRPFDDRRVVMLHPIKRARKRADYELMVENHGNELASCRLRLIDRTDRVDGDFDPPAVGIPPGGANLVRLKLRARGWRFRRANRTLDFDVEAEQPGHQPAAASAALIQPPTIPGSAIRKLIGVGAAVGALAAGWFALIRPELRDLAEEAADERVAEIAPAASVPPVDQPASTATGDSVPTVPPPSGPATGDPFTERLVVQAALNETQTDTFEVPAGFTFDVTDVVLQNQANDSGEATLFRNSEVVYSWTLDNYDSFGNIAESTISPIRFVAGDIVAFQLRCDTYGSPAATACNHAVLLVGRLAPAPG
jgi:hypothetical protein